MKYNKKKRAHMQKYTYTFMVCVMMCARVYVSYEFTLLNETAHG